MKAMQWLIILAVVFLIPAVSAASCQKYTHFLTPNFNFANNNMVFNSLDMDVKQNGIQDRVTVRQGEDTTVFVSWTWGKTCPDCVVNVNVYGTWQEDEITRIYSGIKGGTPLNTNYPISFKAPDTGGEYKLRVIFSYDEELASDFEASNICSSGQCSEAGECHVLIAEGSVNVTSPGANDTSWLPLLEVTSPKRTSPDGIVETELGSSVTIDASADMPVSNFTVKIDGVKRSDLVPYAWDTVNEVEGTHTLIVSAIGSRGNPVSDQMTIRLVNRTLTFGDVPSALWSTELPGKVMGSGISKDGRITVGLDSGKIYVLDKTGIVTYLNKTPLEINSVSVSSDGKRIAAGSGNTLYYLSDNGSLLWSYQSIGGEIKSVSVSSDGKRIAAGSGNTLYYLSGNGSLLWPYQSAGGGITSVSVSSDGKRIAAGSGNTLYYLSGNGSLLWSYQSADGGITSVSVSSDGRRIAAGSANMVEYLNESGGAVWNYTREHMMNLKMVSDGVMGASGNTIFLLSKEGRLTWRYPSKGMGTVSSSPDGRYIAVIKDRSVVFYGGDGKISPAAVLQGKNYAVPGLVLIVLAALVYLLYYRRFRKPQKKTADRPKPVHPEPFSPATPESAAKRLAEADIKEGPIKAATTATTATIAAPGERVTGGAAGIKADVRVINAKTGDPIAGATVTINDVKDKTDKNGTAAVTGILPGEQTLFVERGHYEPCSQIQDVKDGENHFEIRLKPGLVLNEFQERRLQDARKRLLVGFNQVSNFDACLPGYIRGVGENIVGFTEKISYSPELFTTAAAEYGSIMDTLIEIVEEVCVDISDIITDWKNVDLFKASMKLPKGDCDAEEIETGLDITGMIDDPAHFVDMNLASVESKISLVDRTITDRMNELTVMPVSGLWGISRGLVSGNLGNLGGLKGHKRAFGIVMADILSSYVEDMLENPMIVDRLKFSFM
jgi:PQQ-like domain